MTGGRVVDRRWGLDWEMEMAVGRDGRCESGWRGRSVILRITTGFFTKRCPFSCPTLSLSVATPWVASIRRSARLNNSDLPCLQLFTRYTLCG